ncbi:hypothetical protein H5410_048400 [Solanum commersonii]|uniref:Uncharacterized protein n=1 Tax=Solanum commersonii TaxID=4109 RepID=A0A9J5XLL4_SOLCO|nr:hypothetical protein H5410_048400 [Solanum commersonii]
MTDKDDFNAAANIMIPIENPKGSRNMIDIQNGEKMAHMEQELKILREELCEVRDLAKLSATTFPTFKTPILFAKSDFPNQPEQTQHAPTHGQVPPVSPTVVRTVPDLSNYDPIIPTIQQILGAHVAAPYDPHVPPVYAAGVPTFTMLAVVNVPYEVDQYEKIFAYGRIAVVASRLYNRVPLAHQKEKGGCFKLPLTNRKDHLTEGYTIVATAARYFIRPKGIIPNHTIIHPEAKDTKILQDHIPRPSTTPK